MRLLVDSLIALMLVAILAGVLWHYRGQQRLVDDYQFVHTALDRLHDQTLYHKAMDDVTLTEAGFPRKIQPGWFGTKLPVNVLVPTTHPWMDIAPAGDSSTDPPDPVITNPKQAGIWYNPNNGIFRARVTRQLSDEATLEMYNRLNGTSLSSLPDDTTPSTRAPLAYRPGLPIGHDAASERHAAFQASLHDTPRQTKSAVSSQPAPGTSPHAHRNAASDRKPRPTLLSKPAP